MRITKKKTAVVIAVASVAIAGAGGAFAYWTTGGTGTGSASAGTSVAFVVKQDNTLDPLTLDNAQTVEFSVENTASFAQRLTDLTIVPQTPTGGAGNVNLPPCAADDFVVSNIVITKGDIAANSTRTGTASLKLVNKADKNQDNCKNASVALTITAS